MLTTLLKKRYQTKENVIRYSFYLLKVKTMVKATQLGLNQNLFYIKKANQRKKRETEYPNEFEEWKNESIYWSRVRREMADKKGSSL